MRPSKRLTYILLSLLLAPVIIFAGLRLAGTSEHHTDLGGISVGVKPALEGRAEFYAPITDWGVKAHLWVAPVKVRIEPRGLDRDALISISTNRGEVLHRTEHQIKKAVFLSSLQALGWILLVALLSIPLGIWLCKRLQIRARWSVLPGGLALLSSFTVLGLAWVSFDPGAVRKPTYWAKGDELPQLLSFANDAGQAKASYQGSVQKGIQQLASILSGKPAGLQTKDQYWLMSDLHNNVLTLNVVRKLIDHRPVFFAGDFAHEGTPAEQSLLVPSFKGLGNPLIAVSGNHDSLPLMQALAKSGAMVLTQTGRLLADGSTDGNPIYHLGQLKIMGFQDPLQAQSAEQNNREFSISPSEKDKLGREWAKLVRRYRPDVVMVHQSGIADAMASHLSDLPLTILTGHDHMQHVARYGQAVVVDAGTVGAGGLLGAGRQYMGLGRVFLNGKSLQAVDLLRLEPIRGSGQAQRILLDQSCSMDKEAPGRCDYSVQSSADIP